MNTILKVCSSKATIAYTNSTAIGKLPVDSSVWNRRTTQDIETTSRVNLLTCSMPFPSIPNTVIIGVKSKRKTSGENQWRGLGGDKDIVSYE